MLEFSRSQNKIVFFPKNKCTNPFFYPDDSEILETWILISSLQDRKTNSFVPFFGRIYGSTILFWDLLTFNILLLYFFVGIVTAKRIPDSSMLLSIEPKSDNWFIVDLRHTTCCKKQVNSTWSIWSRVVPCSLFFSHLILFWFLPI